MNKKTGIAALAVVAVALVMVFAAAGSSMAQSPLYTFRMEQHSSKMNFSPNATNGFSYTAENGYTIGQGALGYCNGARLLGTDATCHPTCDGWTCDQTGCQNTCDNTCPNTCPVTCPATCPSTCSTCEGQGSTCDATSCQATCPGGTCSPTCYNTCGITHISTCGNTCPASCGYTCPDTCGSTCVETCENCQN